MNNLPNWQVALFSAIGVALIGWGSWVTLGVSKIDQLVTKAELLETKITLIESYQDSENRIIDAIRMNHINETKEEKQ